MGSIYRLLTAGLLATSALAAQPVQAEEQTAPPSTYLVDISASHWCFDCVGKIVNEDRLMGGYTDHTFRGDWKVSRFALASIANKLLNQIRLGYEIKIQPDVNPERPVPALPEHWAYPYVRTLLQEYNLAGMMFTADAPNGDLPISRKHVAYVLSELLMKAEATSGQQIEEKIRLVQKAQDVESRSAFSPYIEAALNRYQFMNLYHDHTFRPEAPVSRYELAAALCRISDLLKTRLAKAPEANAKTAAQ
ncbi:hypothetical protein COW36_18595 [bacterium (Candidatus Blackallbacteria) CG17_big_fil_post_rev_8_21_14_2_50_48_46]|uniref:SLH domain-containing protein n=1 Tax=bacterium (Candidatus Blackallbacteria) CG17_big_fil_post_rev_8_21_14_2_50_48_46 TaxID=2014261 RepID=A0A2M7G144_9BACT|nr:MAG: hypothetical protein COW64_00140 [bacterium (Candidatus Blackallbacteria) CG18_big_fil_WC_8_21_14_2_50_49_26]PIW15424.1 MAG: hypothetical protein COW36_18595 [bacterium (Candidatus Blackallbacteria) CG17_big_fil_post_rev_8_21_14_2_50_48_46]PIW49715.1 MAG: hypothetical protein COW20_04770 [bacterium (Candidatus Blackallbacteria) CG13_big_fil_rev_8_21_14_2_50_49_14]